MGIIEYIQNSLFVLDLNYGMNAENDDRNSLCAPLEGSRLAFVGDELTSLLSFRSFQKRKRPTLIEIAARKQLIIPITKTQSTCGRGLDPCREYHHHRKITATTKKMIAEIVQRVAFLDINSLCSFSSIAPPPIQIVRLFY